MPSHGVGFRDFVAFTVKGDDYCHAYRPGDDCDDEEGVTWAMRELLGFAVVEFVSPSAPRMSRFRFMGIVSPIPSSGERRGAKLDHSRAGAEALINIKFESFEIEDVDGDESEEYVIIVTHDTLEQDSEPDPDWVFESFFHRRLMVFRDDLTLQADGFIHREWHRGAVGWSLDTDFIQEKFWFERPTDSSPGAFVLEWCEVDELLDGCSLDVLCPTPTERITVNYDAAEDNYRKPQRESLRYKAAECDLDEEGDD